MIARALRHTPLMVSASPMCPRILAQRVAHGKRADSYLSDAVVRSLGYGGRLPGKAARVFRAGANLAPEQAMGHRTWEESLADQVS